MSLSSHQSHKPTTVEWLTPPEILEALGDFDLDPCAPVSRPWDMAARHFTIYDNGLLRRWEGRVWLNPPFGAEAQKWLARLAEHGNGIAMVPARTETKAFFDLVWSRADAIVFVRGRPHYHYVTGEKARFNSGAPMVLIAYGKENVEALRTCGLGSFVPLWELEEDRHDA